MTPFEYSMPTNVFFGEGQIKQLGANIPQNAKVLVTYGGGSIKKNGVYEQVVEALKNHTWSEFSGIEPNPQYNTLVKAVEMVKNEGFDYLLAVGGGSVLDGTKFIAAASIFDGNIWDLVEKKEAFSKALPVATIMTLPATGSETNGTSVISNGTNKLAFASTLLRPQIAILDPQVTLSLPAKQTSNGVVDAYVHVIEQYLTFPQNAKVQDRYAEGVMQTLIEEGVSVMQKPNDLNVRSNIMWSATQALNGILGVGVTWDLATHIIGHELTALYNVDHARTLSIVLPAVMKVMKEEKHEKLLQYAQRVFNITEGSDYEKIDMAISKTEEFFVTMGLPVRLSDINLGESDIERIISNLEKHGKTGLGERGVIDYAKSKEILLAAI